MKWRQHVLRRGTVRYRSLKIGYENTYQLRTHTALLFKIALERLAKDVISILIYMVQLKGSRKKRQELSHVLYLE